MLRRAGRGPVRRAPSHDRWPLAADAMKIEQDDLSRPAIHALLDEHLQSMYEQSPPESVHALDLGKLRQPGISFWSAWE